MTIGLADLIK